MFVACGASGASQLALGWWFCVPSLRFHQKKQINRYFFLVIELFIYMYICSSTNGPFMSFSTSPFPHHLHPSFNMFCWLLPLWFPNEAGRLGACVLPIVTDGDLWLVSGRIYGWSVPKKKINKVGPPGVGWFVKKTNLGQLRFSQLKCSSIQRQEWLGCGMLWKKWPQLIKASSRASTPDKLWFWITLQQSIMAM